MAGDFQTQVFIGRLTRDPETKIFNNGMKVAKFSLAFCGRRKQDSSGSWVEEPCYIECQAFNSQGDRGRKLADTVEKYLVKGTKISIQTTMHLEQWTSQDGTKRQALKFTVKELTFLEKKADGSGGNGGGHSGSSRSGGGGGGGVEDFYGTGDSDGGGGGHEEEIPF